MNQTAPRFCRVAAAISAALALSAPLASRASDLPAPVDQAYPGTLTLAVDLSDAPKKIFRVHETIPVGARPADPVLPEVDPRRARTLRPDPERRRHRDQGRRQADRLASRPRRDVCAAPGGTAGRQQHRHRLRVPVAGRRWRVRRERLVHAKPGRHRVQSDGLLSGRSLHAARSPSSPASPCLPGGNSAARCRWRASRATPRISSPSPSTTWSTRR